MRKLIRFTAFSLLAAMLALLFAQAASLAEAGSGLSGFRIDPEAEILVLDAAGIRTVDREDLAELIDSLPNLKEVDLFDAEMPTEDQEWLFERYYPNIFFGFTIHIGPHAIRTD